jgi:hypothetical protein
MGIDAAVSFPSGGGVGATVEAARGGGRRWPVGPCSGLGRSGGRGPVGEGRENQPVKKRLGRKAGWAESDGENYFPNKI